MKKLFFACLLAATVVGCSTVQVAQFDKTLPPTEKVDFYNSAALVPRSFREIGYLAYNGKVSDLNDTRALGRLLEQARKMGADGLILEPPNLGQADLGSFKAIAIVYE